MHARADATIEVPAKKVVLIEIRLQQEASVAFLAYIIVIDLILFVC